MKLYEWILVIVNVTLIYAGIALIDHNAALSVVVFIIAALLFLSYIYFIKTAPMKRLRQKFTAAMVANNFLTVTNISVKKDVLKMLTRKFHEAVCRGRKASE